MTIAPLEAKISAGLLLVKAREQAKARMLLYLPLET